MPENLRQYVILHHVLADGEHWDFMLDQGQALATWQLASDPASLAPADTQTAISARRIADHRRAYLDYEGPISRGRGTVTRVDRGIYELTRQTSSEWGIRLEGQLLSGDFRLTAIGDTDEGTLSRVRGVAPASRR